MTCVSVCAVAMKLVKLAYVIVLNLNDAQSLGRAAQSSRVLVSQRQPSTERNAATEGMGATQCSVQSHRSSLREASQHNTLRIHALINFLLYNTVNALGGLVKAVTIFFIRYRKTEDVRPTWGSFTSQYC
jgi:hypothetical protein